MPSDATGQGSTGTETVAEQPTATTGNLSGGMITGIFDSIDGALDGWYAREGDRRQAFADDPCRYKVELDDWIVKNVLPQIRTANINASVIASVGIQAQNNALNNLGRPSTQYIGVTSWGSWAASSGELPIPPAAAGILFLLLGPVAAGAEGAWAGFIQNRTREGRVPYATRAGSNKGFEVYAGVYLYAAGASAGSGQHLATGILRGDRVRSAWLTWRNTVVRPNVAPPAVPSWRAELVKLVGRARSGWLPWNTGDPIAASSKIGQLEQLRAYLLGLRATEASACALRPKFPPYYPGGGYPPIKPKGSGGGMLLLLLLAFVLLRSKNR